MDAEAINFEEELNKKVDQITQDHVDSTVSIHASAVYDLDEIEKKMRAELQKVTDRLDNQFDDILARLDEAEKKVMELPEGTDIQQWLRDNPQYDPKNMKRLQQEAKKPDVGNYSKILSEIG